MAVTAVLFDIDNTLLDTPTSMAESARRALRAVAPELPGHAVEAGAAIWLADAQGRYEQYLAGALSFIGQRTRRVQDLFAALGLPDPGEAGAARWLEFYRSAQLSTVIVYDDVWPCLRALGERPIGAVSNNDGQWQRYRLSHAGLDDAIAHVVGIDDAGAAKPDPAIFAAGCAALGVQPEHTLYVGDDIDADARGATAAGLRGVWLDRLGEQAVPPDVRRISTLAELPALLG